MKAPAAKPETGRSRRKDRGILLIGSAQSCPDLVYASGFRSSDPVIFFQRGHEKYLLVSPMELGRASRLPGVTAMTRHMLPLRKAERSQGMFAWAAGLLRHLGETHVEVPSWFPCGAMAQLERAGIGVRIIEPPSFPERAVKTPREIRAMSEAQQAAVISMRRVVAMLSAATVGRDGELKSRGKTVTAEMVQSVIHRTLLDHSCSCRDVIVACGKQGADPHERGSGALRSGEAIVVDIFPEHLEHGYCGDLTRTVVKGKAPKNVRKMYTAVKAAQAAALARIRPGVNCATVHKAAAEEIRRRGFETNLAERRGFIHGTGHGVGLEVHESPTIAPVKGRLRKGHVITVEPGLYDPNIGGMRIEDTVVVTSEGWKHLAPCEKRLEVH